MEKVGWAVVGGIPSDVILGSSILLHSTTIDEWSMYVVWYVCLKVFNQPHGQNSKSRY